MRIIAGEFRSRKLLPPATEATRPITDRVKQSLFDIISLHLEGARVYDCFAGTGSMGLECLSRGASHATFFEADRSAVALLKKNIATLGVENRSTVIDRDLFKWFDAGHGERNVDVIFLDPPYRFLNQRPDDLRRLVSKQVEHLSADGVIVFRHDEQDSLELPSINVVDQRTYGGMSIQFLSPRPKTG